MCTVIFLWSYDTITIPAWCSSQVFFCHLVCLPSSALRQLSLHIRLSYTIGRWQSACLRQGQCGAVVFACKPSRGRPLVTPDLCIANRYRKRARVLYRGRKPCCSTIQQQQQQSKPQQQQGQRRSTSPFPRCPILWPPGQNAQALKGMWEE